MIKRKQYDKMNIAKDRTQTGFRYLRTWKEFPKKQEETALRESLNWELRVFCLEE